LIPWLSQSSSLGIFKLIDECAPRKSVFWKPCASSVQMGQPSCLAGPESGIAFAPCLMRCEHFAGKKEKLSPCLNEILTQSMQIINYI